MAKTKKSKKIKPEPVFTYDPESQFVVIQHGGSSSEFYSSLFDSIEEADEHVVSCNKATYDTEAPESFSRSPLERVAPLLFKLLKDSVVEFQNIETRREAEALIAYAERTQHLNEIVGITATWWAIQTVNKIPGGK